MNKAIYYGRCKHAGEFVLVHHKQNIFQTMMNLQIRKNITNAHTRRYCHLIWLWNFCVPNAKLSYQNLMKTNKLNYDQWISKVPRLSSSICPQGVWLKLKNEQTERTAIRHYSNINEGTLYFSFSAQAQRLAVASRSVNSDPEGRSSHVNNKKNKENIHNNNTAIIDNNEVNTDG